MSSNPRPSHVFALVATAVAAGAIFRWLEWPDAARAVEFSALMVAAIVSSLPAVQHADRDWPAFRLSFVFEFATLIMFGAQPAMVVAACGIVTREVSPSAGAARPISRIASAVTVLVSLQAAAWVYTAVGGTLTDVSWPMQAVPIAAALLAACLVGSLSAEIVMPLVERRSIALVWQEWPMRFLQECPVHVVGASVAAALAEGIANRQWAVLIVALPPLYLAWRVYADHAARLEHDRLRSEALESRVALLSRQLTEHSHAVTTLRRKGERLALAAEIANDALWEWDLGTDRLHVTERWKVMVGLPADAAIAKPEDWFSRVHEDDLAALKQALDAHLAGKTDRFQHEHRIRHEDGTYRFFLCRGVAARIASGRPTHLAGSLTDTTDLAITQERLRNAVYLDPLTGLYNRAVFVEGLGRRLKESQRRQGVDLFALLYLDLDRFKVVNDSLGHLVGDELLIAVSRRLESCLRTGDVLARLGGDEFAILLNGLQTDQQANVIAIRVQQALSKPFAVGGREVFTSASIGIAFGGAHYNTPDEMMHDADTAMYQAKAHGKARHEVFDADMDARARDRLGLENDLRKAVNNYDFETHYQPIVSLASGMCVGFESLVRWTRDGKPVSPATFIPMAEELGLIERLGTRVLEEACRTFANWQRAYPDAGLDCITVNVSSRQLMQPNFLSVVDRAVRQAGLHPSCLRIEITETALMTNPDEAAKMLSQLRDFGVKIYLDDFGTGYSSLSHLHKLPVDALKIDRSFVRSLTLPNRPAIVESILALARTLHTSVVAEGIETDVQARELERLGCTHAQGYLFSKAVSSASVEAILMARLPLGPKRGEATVATVH